MRKHNPVKSVFAALVVTLGGFLIVNQNTSQVAQGATSYIVNDVGSDCGSYVATYSSVQMAVNDAITNNAKTILVCPGSYNDFSVLGANKLTIKAALPGTPPTIKAPVASSGVIVYVDNSSGVVLDGLRIDGTFFEDALANSTIGVYFSNSSGTVQNSTITRLRCFPDLCGYGDGIIVADVNADGKASTLIIKNVNVTDVNTSGIQAQGQTKLTVSDSRITGNFSGGADVGLIGVYFNGSGATGSVTKSSISNAASAVRINGSSNVKVSSNTISGAQNEVFIETTCTGGFQIANSTAITGNIFNNITENGVKATSPASGCTHIEKTTISGNTFIGTSSSIGGIYFFAPVNAYVDKTKISGNAIYGFGYGISVSLNATNTSLSKNSWMP